MFYKTSISKQFTYNKWNISFYFLVVFKTIHIAQHRYGIFQIYVGSILDNVYLMRNITKFWLSNSVLYSNKDIISNYFIQKKNSRKN